MAGYIYGIEIWIYWSTCPRLYIRIFPLAIRTIQSGLRPSFLHLFCVFILFLSSGIKAYSLNSTTSERFLNNFSCQLYLLLEVNPKSAERMSRINIFFFNSVLTDMSELWFKLGNCERKALYKYFFIFRSNIPHTTTPHLSPK